METFRDLAANHAHVGKARGLGAMCGLEIVDPETGTPDPQRTARILKQALDNGLLAMSASSNTIRTLMPLTIDTPTLEAGLQILSQSIANNQ